MYPLVLRKYLMFSVFLFFTGISVEFCERLFQHLWRRLLIFSLDLLIEYISEFPNNERSLHRLFKSHVVYYFLNVMLDCLPVFYLVFLSGYSVINDTGLWLCFIGCRHWCTSYREFEFSFLFCALEQFRQHRCPVVFKGLAGFSCETIWIWSFFG